MNGWLGTATTAPAAGRLPLAIALLAPFHRLAPVPLGAGHGARRGAGAGR